MNKGIKLRLIIHNILYDIYVHNKTVDNTYQKNKIGDLDERDRSFINNICLNTMRFYFHSKKILRNLLKKKSSTHQEILLCCSITQILFLDIKDYAVVNSSVELGKKLKLYHGLINAVLIKISNNKEKYKRISIRFTDLPEWFQKKSENLSKKEKINFINNFYKEPDLHLVFKDKRFLSEFEEKLYKTSDKSGFLIKREKVNLIPSYKRGTWWVQDFSSSFPLINIEKSLLSKSNIDLCAAPGGKSFQILSKNKKITLNDKNKARLKILRDNLNRLNYKAEITNYNLNKKNKLKKYDFIILDAPCSSVGTIRKNPEIFFRKQEPNYEDIINTQRLMLENASKILNSDGIILYMVCSFIKSETTDQIDYFLKKNQDFSVRKFFSDTKNDEYTSLIKESYMLTIPTHINGYNIDGYFAVYLKRGK